MTGSKSFRLASAGAVLSLVACGKMGDLRPPEGHALPVKPVMARATPTPDELLTPPAYADPNRVDELMKKSAPRQADPFDLPPPSGQAPPAPAEDTNTETSSMVGPVTPQ